jgi:hypothetical protein
VSIGIDRPGIKFEIVYGVSANTRSWYDNANAERLGYRPEDDSEAYAAEVLAREKPGDPTAEIYQGGVFVVALGEDARDRGVIVRPGATERERVHGGSVGWCGERRRSRAAGASDP